MPSTFILFILEIFFEIDKPLDFYENTSTNIVLNIISYDVRFLRKFLFKKLFSFKIILYAILKKIIFQYFPIYFEAKCLLKYATNMKNQSFIFFTVTYKINNFEYW